MRLSNPYREKKNELPKNFACGASAGIRRNQIKPVNLHTVKMQGPGTDVQMDVYKIKPVRSYLNEA